ncbi:MAG TPA: hypothetical protein VED47_14010 [Burkholderiaceae bacterium]|nr:hypothetical protein [Burkholderiaceae bacterium]
MNLASLIPSSSWSVLAADFLIVLHLTISGVTLAAILHLASAKWRYVVRSIGVSLFSLYPLAFVLLLILLLARHGVFPWLHAEAAGEHEHALNGWHNPAFFAAREIVGLLFVGWLWRRFIRLQAVSERSEEDWERFKMTANFVPVTHVLYGTMVAWDFEMTLLPSWESSVYGMYHFVSNFGMFLSSMVVICYLLDRRRLFVKPFPDIVYNYFAQMMLAFTILWTYLYFAQYLTIWYGNLPEERNRIDNMTFGDYSVLWWTFLAMKFVIPFCFLVFTYFRHSPVSVFRIGLIIIAGTWIERFTWIAGSWPTNDFVRAQYPFTHVFDVVVTAIVLLVGWLLVRRGLGRNEVTSAGLGGASVQAA